MEKEPPFISKETRFRDARNLALSGATIALLDSISIFDNGLNLDKAAVGLFAVCIFLLNGAKAISYRTTPNKNNS